MLLPPTPVVTVLCLVSQWASLISSAQFLPCEKRKADLTSVENAKVEFWICLCIILKDGYTILLKPKKAAKDDIAEHKHLVNNSRGGQNVKL